MDIILEILRGMHPEVDFDHCETLIDNRIIDSFDIVTIISEINDQFDITVPVEDIIPKNFNSAKALYAMVERLIEEE